MAELDWRDWREMALASLRAAQALDAIDPRSCVSRCYYAAYQAVTAVLLYGGVTPPADREAWSHENTPGLLAEKWEPFVRARDRRQDLKRRLEYLYRLRVSADYVSAAVIEPVTAQRTLRECGFLVRTATEILPEG